MWIVRSAPAARDSSWVTITKVAPIESRSSKKRFFSSSRLWLSRLPVGSSAKTTFGLFGGAVGETLGEAEFRQEGAGALHSLAPGATGNKRGHCHILLNRELGEEAVGLEDEADVGVAEAREGAVAQGFHVLTVIEDASALLGLEESAENLEKGGLPGAGGADNGCNLPGGDVQGDFAKHFKGAEALGYVPCRKHRLTKVQKSCHLSKPLSIFINSSGAAICGSRGLL